MDTFVITSRCADACDTACVDVCPVDCIHGPVPNDALQEMPPDQRVEARLRLYIDPDLCICCAACQPVCPADAVHHALRLPLGEETQLDLARRFFKERAAGS